jgi:hypothetical protein
MSNAAPHPLTCPCGAVFIARTNNVKLCPPCRHEHARVVKLMWHRANPLYKPKWAEPEHRAPTHRRNISSAWVLVEVPPGCDFRPGATFTSTDMAMENCREWVQAGMVFESSKGVRRF